MQAMHKVSVNEMWVLDTNSTLKWIVQNVGVDWDVSVHQRIAER